MNLLSKGRNINIFQLLTVPYCSVIRLTPILMARIASVCKTFLTSGTKFGSHYVGVGSYTSRVA